MFLFLCLQFNPTLTHADNDNEQLIKDGIVYEFQSVPKYDLKGIKMYGTGLIKVSSEEGQLISLSRYTHSPNSCETGYPAISSLDIPLLPSLVYGPKVRETNFIVFCGSSGGRHSTLRFYKPNFGFVSAIDFFDGPVNVKKNESGVTAVISHRTYFFSYMSDVYYSIMFNVYSNGLDIELVADFSEKSKAFYAETLQASLPRLKLSSTRSERVHYAELARVLIYAQLSEDEKIYCEVSEKIPNNKLYKIQKRIKEKLSNHFNVALLKDMECN